MNCVVCQKEYDIDFFLPKPGNTMYYEECVYCMKEKYSILEKILDASCHEGVSKVLQKQTAENLSRVNSITCLQENIISISDLAKHMYVKHIRPQEEQRIKNQIIFKFKCATDESCNASFEAYESQDGGFVLQTLINHSCLQENRHLNRELLEIAKFKKFMQKLMNCLSESDILEVDSWSTRYTDTSTVYKKQQNLLHQLEDEAIAEIWGLPCAWRRSRGEQNVSPQKEDLNKLEQIAQKKQVQQSVIEHIQNNLDVESTSSYFQQRGYFILISLSPKNILNKIIRKRIQIMLYALNLLNKDMFLLCYKKLNPTALRNHAMMIALLLMSFAAQQQQYDFPIYGTTDPKDSDVENLYEILDVLPQQLFVID